MEILICIANDNNNTHSFTKVFIYISSKLDDKSSQISKLFNFIIQSL